MAFRIFAAHAHISIFFYGKNCALATRSQWKVSMLTSQTNISGATAPIEPVGSSDESGRPTLSDRANQLAGRKVFQEIETIMSPLATCSQCGLPVKGLK